MSNNLKHVKNRKIVAHNKNKDWTKIEKTRQKYKANRKLAGKERRWLAV